MNNEQATPKHLSDTLWDLWCISSIVGIWPRFIEPNLVSTTHLNLQISHLPEGLKGFKILQLSDLHLNKRVPDYFLNKIIKKIKALSPDIIVFTGDFLCYSRMKDRKRLQKFLNSLRAPHGCFAILGNHDYEASVSINENGDYDLIVQRKSMIKEGFKRLFTTTKLTGVINPGVRALGLNQELVDVLKHTPFKLLHNETDIIRVNNCSLNICGLGEYTLGRCLPELAFKSYDKRFPGVILAHNPDSVPVLESYPGDVLLCGHTHGGQINLPWMWKKFTLLENMQYKKGLHRVGSKWVYISRGIGGVMSFRWFAMPELVLITLENGYDKQ
jgi:uncharacterized protein